VDRDQRTEDRGRTHDSDSGELLKLFTERLVAAGGQIVVSGSVEAAARVVYTLARERGTREVVSSAELTEAMPALREAVGGAGLSWRVPQAAAEARDAPLGLSLGRLAVAETGSVLLAEATLADRAIGLMSAAQVVICPRQALIPSLDEAASVLRAQSAQGAYATLVTGPSRTADIERELTIGVQGPAEFHVLILGTMD
jgi:L-lactate dehydrogenase complex protein LldG